MCPDELVACPFAEDWYKERVRHSQFDDHMTSSIQKHADRSLQECEEKAG